MSDLLLGIFGCDFEWDDSAAKTADRLLRALMEFTPKPQPFKATTFHTESKGMVMCGPITFSSICKHHMWPYLGHAWVGYISNAGLIIGLSKIPRLVKWMASKPTTQEQLSSEIVAWLDETLNPKGVMVVIEAVHTCMSCRGVRETDARMVTSLPTGVFSTVESARAEFLHFVEHSR